MIDIIGYITETYGKDSFMIKITSDEAPTLSCSNIQVSKEVTVSINASHFPSDDRSQFQKLSAFSWDDPRWNDINKSHFLCDTLKKGDQIECTVYIIGEKIHNKKTGYNINNNPIDIKNYAEAGFQLWLSHSKFQRLDVDSQESLKFRKQWFYTCQNRKKCEEITKHEWNRYREKWWINKNP